MYHGIQIGNVSMQSLKRNHIMIKNLRLQKLINFLTRKRNSLGNQMWNLFFL